MRTELLTSSIHVDTDTILGRTVFVVLGQNQSRRPKRPQTPVLGRSPSNAVRTPRAHRTCACRTPNDQPWSRTRPGRQSELTAHTCAPCTCHSVGRRRSFRGDSVRPKRLLWFFSAGQLERRSFSDAFYMVFIEFFTIVSLKSITQTRLSMVLGAAQRFLESPSIVSEPAIDRTPLLSQSAPLIRSCRSMYEQHICGLNFVWTTQVPDTFAMHPSCGPRDALHLMPRAQQFYP